MEGFDIAKMLAEFVLAGVIWLMSERQVKLLMEQIKERDERIRRAEERAEEATAEHMRDLRDWSGIDPRFHTWSMNEESPTKRRLDATERARIAAEAERKSGGFGK